MYGLSIIFWIRASPLISKPSWPHHYLVNNPPNPNFSHLPLTQPLLNNPSSKPLPLTSSNLLNSNSSNGNKTLAGLAAEAEQHLSSLRLSWRICVTSWPRTLR